MPLDPNDPLLPAPSAEGWIDLPADETAEEWAKAASSVRDYFVAHTLVIPAFDQDGEPVIPPDSHVLDRLAREHDLVDDDEAASRPEAGTVAVVSWSTSCDVCGNLHARYDALMEHQGRRVGANLCSSCFATHGDGRLGIGHAAYLMLTGEVSPEVRAICNEICARLGKTHLFSE